MIFASDLDRTLIYSKRACGTDLFAPNIRAVEQIPERDISYMTETAIHLLSRVNEAAHFIPATTRTRDLYHRISLFQKKIVPKYAVVSNGGTILVDGEEDREWAGILRKKLEAESAHFEEIMNEFERVRHPDWVLDARICDDLFCSSRILDEKAPLQELKEFEIAVDALGWSLSLQEKKLYMTPKPLTKWAAVEYVSEKLGAGTVITAGDSKLDLCMLEVADYALTPRHGEILEKKLKFPQNVYITASSGIHAGEEMLQHVLGIMADPHGQQKLL
ncbi:hypothetical protein [Peribacillus kribbensis]|uniref:hypothetical protein n=1 Tax=Peribacillus kribbensis TaxID=356658 RepID=UPI0003FBCFBC|nr:hypothetical protein [Peribacillus kribbensis]